jgi:hypothetical protein
MGKFQIIKPYPSDKIYESSNVNKCAKKFYEILKQDNEKYDFFILRNIDNNNYYKFKIKNNHHMQIGGKNVEKKIYPISAEPKLESKIETKLETKDNNDLINRIEKIESRVTVLENKKESSSITQEIKKEDNNSDKSEGGKLYDKPKRGLITPPQKNENMCIIM